MKVVNLSIGEWAHLLKGASTTTPFHTNEWLTVLEQTYGCEIQRLGFLEKGHLVGGIPIAVRKKFIYRIAGSPVRGLATPYQGPICEDPIQHGIVLEAFWRYAASMKWDFVEVSPSPDSPLIDWTSNDSRTRRETRQTICLDLTRGVEKIFKEMEAECRNQVRQSEKRGAELREVDLNKDEWIDSYYDLSVELYRRQARPPAIPKSFFRHIQVILAPLRKMRVLLAMFDNQVVAGGVFLLHEGTLYYWDGVSSQAYNHLRPNHLIQWSIIRWACEQGLQTYDMVGANLPGIAQFKKSFGGVYVSYPSYQRSNGWLGRLGELGYRKLAPIARRIAVRIW